MATVLSTILARVRDNLHEPTARLWTDATLYGHMNGGIADLWRAINIKAADFYLEVDTTNVSLAANSLQLTGVPADVAVVRSLEPRVPADYPYLKFESRPWNHALFREARSMDAYDPQALTTLFFSVTGEGAPIGAPVIRIAPKVSTALNLMMGYVKTLGTLGASDDNPIPGESDKAIEFYTTALARAKIREDQTPDPDWLALYATEKKNILTFVAPRDEQDIVVADALFGDTL